MNNHLLFQKLTKHHHFSEPILAKEMKSICEYQQLSCGATLIRENQFIKWFVIILDGQIRVWQENHEKEISLYYLKKYETCAYSVVAIEKQYQSFVNATTTSKTATILKIPTSKIKEWKRFSSWNTFINNTLTAKYEIMLKIIQSLAFRSLDDQLLIALQQFSDRQHSKKLYISHQTLANEIGISREVVSRKLKEFEKKEWLTLGYNKIYLKKIPQL